MVYRIVDSKYKEDLSGSGAKEHGGRWNPKGKPVLYCSEHISLSMLENMVYMTQGLIQRSCHLLHISISETSITQIDHKALKRNWVEDVDYTRWLGSQFLDQNGFILKVPSAIVKQEFNFVINTEHVLFKKIKILTTEAFQFDERLLI